MEKEGRNAKSRESWCSWSNCAPLQLKFSVPCSKSIVFVSNLWSSNMKSKLVLKKIEQVEWWLPRRGEIFPGAACVCVWSFIRFDQLRKRRWTYCADRSRPIMQMSDKDKKGEVFADNVCERGWIWRKTHQNSKIAWLILDRIAVMCAMFSMYFVPHMQAMLVTDVRRTHIPLPGIVVCLCQFNAIFASKISELCSQKIMSNKFESFMVFILVEKEWYNSALSLFGFTKPTHLQVCV